MDALYSVMVVGSGVAAHLLIAAMFVLRVTAPSRAHAWGLAGTAAAIPLTIAAVRAFVVGGEPWAVVLPLVFVAFAVVEVLVDDVVHFDVRHSRWLGPYLALFYAGSWGLIGAAFLASPLGGFMVLGSYFVCLAATFWSYRRVGHGEPVHLPS